MNSRGNVKFFLLVLVYSFLGGGIAGCSTPPASRPPGSPDPGALHKDAQQEIKVGVGKAGPGEGDNTDRYEKRDDGLLDNKAIGFKSIWRF